MEYLLPLEYLYVDCVSFTSVSHANHTENIQEASLVSLRRVSFIPLFSQNRAEPPISTIVNWSIGTMNQLINRVVRNFGGIESRILPTASNKGTTNDVFHSPSKSF